MKHPFNFKNNSVIYIKGRIINETKELNVPFILDTGASSTILHSEYLTAVGYNLKRDSYGSEQIITAGGIVTAFKIKLEHFQILGKVLENYPVLSYYFQPQMMMGGILGNDFLKDFQLTINFPLRWIQIE